MAEIAAPARTVAIPGELCQIAAYDAARIGIPLLGAPILEWLFDNEIAFPKCRAWCYPTTDVTSGKMAYRKPWQWEFASTRDAALFRLAWDL